MKIVRIFEQSTTFHFARTSHDKTTIGIRVGFISKKLVRWKNGCGKIGAIE